MISKGLVDGSFLAFRRGEAVKTRCKRPYGRMLLLAAPVAVVLAVAGCGSSSSPSTSTSTSSPSPSSNKPQSVQDVLNSLSKMSGSARQSYLVKQAEKEGTVVMYSGIAPATDAAWQTAFNAAYPGVHAQIIRLDDADMQERATSEAAAGKPIASLLVWDAGDYPAVNELFAAYKSPSAAGLPASVADPSGLLTVLQYEPMVNVYNTKEMQRSQVPTTLQGLTNPDLKGKIGIASLDGPLWLGATQEVLGVSKADSLAKQVSQQNVVQFASTTDLINAVSSGQVPMAWCAVGATVFQAKASGAPIGYVATDPLYVTPLYLNVTNDAPDPYAAALLYDWLLSKNGGQKIDTQVGSTGPLPNVKYIGSPILKQAKRIVPFSNAVEKNLEGLTATFQADFGQ